MSVRIGVEGLVYSTMTTEDSISTAPTYAATTQAPGVISININPNGSVETLFADDGPMESASTLGKIEVEVKKAALSTQNQADLLGHTIDANGGLVCSDTDVPPYVAVGFKTLKSNGKYKYTWLYKGKFTEPESQNETKGESISYQTDTIKGQFVKLTHPVTIGGKSLRPWKYDIDEDDTLANAVTIAKWFTAPVMPSSTKDVS